MCNCYIYYKLFSLYLDVVVLLLIEKYECDHHHHINNVTVGLADAWGVFSFLQPHPTCQIPVTVFT